METALKALNQLVADGIIRDYAIGGAIGAAFYIDALQTEDIDAFVFLPGSSGGFVLLTPIYEALIALGGVIEREYVRFGEWPVQILTDSNQLIDEAIRLALTADYKATPTRVFRPEHLCAIALQTGRRKDYARVAMFLEQKAVDRGRLMQVLAAYALTDRLSKVEQPDVD